MRFAVDMSICMMGLCKNIGALFGWTPTLAYASSDTICLSQN